MRPGLRVDRPWWSAGCQTRRFLPPYGLMERARDANLAAVSLSVEDENPAMRLYERVGFAAVDHADGAATMILCFEH